jgi:hypothetical protein
MAPDDLFTRDEALGGLPARRAAAALFLIESRTARLADESSRAADFFVSEEAAHRRDLLFLEAFNGGREPPVAPTIERLEQFAPQWAALVPPGPSIRAAIAYMLGRKYVFTRHAVPRVRGALGLDDETVARAYRRHYREELASIYAPRLGPSARLRLAWSALSARIDALSPFWLTFWLTIGFSFSQAFLALPTGVASLGALPGVGLVIAVGLVNVLTMACMAEACARSGDFRYGRVFVGRLVAGYLGAEASAVFSVITAVRTFLVTLAGSIGLGLTLAASTGIRAELWLAALTAVELYYLSRRSLNVTVTTMLSLVGVNIALFLLITMLALPWIEPAQLLRTPVSSGSGGAFEPAVLKLVFGVIVMLYIGHVYVVQCAKIVLPRDPGGRALIRGSVAGTAGLAAVFVVWILAVNGVVSAERLLGEAGTALPALAERLGPATQVLGSLLVVLLLGMSCLRTSTVLFNLVQERLPSRLRVVLTLPRRRGDLLFQSRTGVAPAACMGVRYLGLGAGQARFGIAVQRAGTVDATEVAVGDRWDGGPMLAGLPSPDARDRSLVLEVLEASPEAVTVRITTTLSLTAGGDWNGAARHITDVAALADPDRELVAWLTRRGEATAAEISGERGDAPAAVRTRLEALVAEGFVEAVGSGAAARYRAHLGARPRRQVPDRLWTALGEPAAAPERRRHGPGARARLSVWGLLLSEGGRFVLSTSPVLLVFLIGGTLLVARTASFAGVLGFGGVIANSLTAGIFPVLLLVASRRKGDCLPGVAYGVLGHPAFTAGVYALALINLVLHGLVIYQDTWMRACAILLTLVVLGATARMVRAGAFVVRTTLELREDRREGGANVLTIMSGGRPLAADVTLHEPGGETTRRVDTLTLPDLSKLQAVSVRLPAGPARQLKVWVHQVTADGVSAPWPALVEIRCGAETSRFDLRLSGGQAVAPMSGECRVRIGFPAAAEA